MTLYERGSHLGGMMIDGIPRFRLPVDQVQKEIALIIDSGVQVKLGRDIGARNSRSSATSFDAVLVATGTVKGKELGLGGEVRPLSGLKFMKDYNDGEIQHLEGDVVVIGGGFTAVDCARACARAARRILGSEHIVTIAYRRTEHHMAADLEELDEIKFENIEVRTLATPLRINTVNGQLVSVTFQKNKLSDQKGADGKPGIEPIPGSEYDIPCRHLIAAVGQDADWSILPKELQPAQEPKVFVAGEFRTGSSDVIHCVAEGKEAAERIDLFLTGQVRVKHHIAVDLVENRVQTGRTRDDDLRRPAPMPLAPLQARVDGTHEVMKGHTDDGIASHASRCYQCNFQIRDRPGPVHPLRLVHRRGAPGVHQARQPHLQGRRRLPHPGHRGHQRREDHLHPHRQRRVHPLRQVPARLPHRRHFDEEDGEGGLRQRGQPVIAVANARAEGRLPGAGGWVPLRAKA